ncbi:hypothetical protein KHS38_01745 [Mucilaginibacter sp. Bleaf8]|uniref:tetratricopeptide repeat protein n=1 Tax=Mucilaginibacter sp. Bleaf8 TaxID=2834430 RepID=UPI001BCABFEA|nr:hypothetical protein [Mucilaginibacter sp. Bleaf8]MBS7563115.1 hypothetical protein [Mucilaginibacter sp. Bleaf8]
MKIKFLITGALSLASVTVFAQKGELDNAQKEFGSYETARGQQALASVAKTSITNAKTSIDKAAANEKTATMPRTYALKAAIYGAMAYQDTVVSTSAPLYTAGVEALQKAKEADKSGEFKSLTDAANQYLGVYSLNKGVREFQGKQFEDAYKSFDFYRSINPEDTTAILYTGLAAVNTKNYPVAINNYKKLLTTKYSKNEGVYGDLSSIYLETKDTTNALSTLTEGVSKYPSSAALRSREIELGLTMGKQAEILDKIQGAIANDPKNKFLYYYAGIAYVGSANGVDKKLKQTKAATEVASLQKQKNDNLAKATDMFKKSLEIDPNYAPAAVSLSDALITPIVDEFNAANKLPTSKAKEYAAAMAKVNTQLDAIKPQLLKAVELDPKSASALTNLRNYYLVKKDNVKATELSKKINAL